MRGRRAWEHRLLGDHVLAARRRRRHLQLANPIDDARHGITHVIRGEDLLLHAAPGAVLGGARPPVPAFAHLPMILGADKKRLSSGTARPAWRSSARPATCRRRSSTTSRCSAGASTTRPRAVRAHELIERFTIERVNPSPARLRPPEAGMDERRLPARARRRPRRPAARVPRERGSPIAGPARADRRGHAAGAGEDRDAGRVRGVRRFLFRPVVYDQEAWQKVAAVHEAAEILDARAARRRWRHCRASSRPSRGGAARRVGASSA